MEQHKTRVVEIYIICRGALDDFDVTRRIQTDAPDEIIEKICLDVKNDGIYKAGSAVDAIVNIIKARGFICEPVEIQRFGYKE